MYPNPSPYLRPKPSSRSTPMWLAQMSASGSAVCAPRQQRAKSQRCRRNVRVKCVVDARAPAGAGKIAEHRKVRRKPQREEPPTRPRARIERCRGNGHNQPFKPQKEENRRAVALERQQFAAGTADAVVIADWMSRQAGGCAKKIATERYKRQEMKKGRARGSPLSPLQL